MIKKIGLMFVLFITLLISANAVVITDCNTLPSSSTTYKLAPNFVYSSANCFNTNGLTDVTIDGMGVYLPNSIAMGGGDNIILKNIVADSVVFSASTNLLIDNFTIYAQNNDLWEVTGAQGVNTKTLTNITIQNSYWKVNPFNANAIYLFRANQPSNPCCSSNNNVLYIDGELKLLNNDFFGFQELWGGFSSVTNYKHSVSFTNTIMTLKYNNFGMYVPFGSTTHTGTFLTECINHDLTGNFWANVGTNDDSDYDGMFDNPYSITENTCLMLNEMTPSKRAIENPLNAEYSNEVMMAILIGNSNFYDNYKHYYLIGSKTLNVTHYIAMQNVQGTTMDLTFAPLTTLTGVNQIRLGINNKLFGGALVDANDKPEIRIESPTIIANAYNSTNLYANLWYLMSYYSDLTIDNIRFTLASTDSYGLLSKGGSNQGDNLVIKNSIIQNARVPTDLNTPMFLVGSRMRLENNQFLLGQVNNMLIFKGGATGGIGGGHYVVDNTFTGGGNIFQELTDGTTNNLQSKFIHNKFDKTGSVYSYIFSLSADALLDNPTISSKYYYKPNSCDSYEFIIGNYYQDLVDLAPTLADTTGFGIDSVGWNRGTDINSALINDNAVLLSYPYDFSANLGYTTFIDLCSPFKLTATSPVEQQTYGSVVAGTFSFDSSTYPIMQCFASFDGLPTLFTDVGTGDTKTFNVNFGTDDGSHLFELKCCDTIACDNLVKEITPITFYTNSAIVDVYGCTDNTANNYNPSATIDDGSCTYGGTGGNGTGGGTYSQYEDDYSLNIIDKDSIDNTFSNLVGLVADFGNGVGMIVIPIAIFLFVLFIVFALINLITL